MLWKDTLCACAFLCGTISWANGNVTGGWKVLACVLNALCTSFSRFYCQVRLSFIAHYCSLLFFGKKNKKKWNRLQWDVIFYKRYLWIEVVPFERYKESYSILCMYVCNIRGLQYIYVESIYYVFSNQCHIERERAKTSQHNLYYIYTHHIFICKP